MFLFWRGSLHGTVPTSLENALEIVSAKEFVFRGWCFMPRVLIADDEESMRSLVARAIAMDGHEIVTAEDGAEALEILNREAGAFDLLLTDIKMPVMDGIALALAVARDFPGLTILLMTGFADQRERASGLNAIVHDVVTKPFSVADIRTAVADALAARKGTC
jgi:two-component system cell cycle response regulator CpdR